MRGDAWRLMWASRPGAQVESKGLKPGALGLVSATVVGVASAAPAYSLAATLGLVVAAGVGFKSPAIMWISFIPMGCIAAAFFYLNRADPDCGTNFTWVTRAIGPRWGWMGGWSSAVADLLIMPNLAAIAAVVHAVRSSGSTTPPAASGGNSGSGACSSWA